MALGLRILYPLGVTEYRSPAGFINHNEKYTVTTEERALVSIRIKAATYDDFGTSDETPSTTDPVAFIHISNNYNFETDKYLILPYEEGKEYDLTHLSEYDPTSIPPADITDVPEYDDDHDTGLMRIKNWVLDEGEGEKSVYIRFVSSADPASIFPDQTLSQKGYLDTIVVVKNPPSTPKTLKAENETSNHFVGRTLSLSWQESQDNICGLRNYGVDLKTKGQIEITEECNDLLHFDLPSAQRDGLIANNQPALLTRNSSLSPADVSFETVEGESKIRLTLGNPSNTRRGHELHIENPIYQETIGNVELVTKFTPTIPAGSKAGMYFAIHNFPNVYQNAQAVRGLGSSIRITQNSGSTFRNLPCSILVTDGTFGTSRLGASITVRTELQDEPLFINKDEIAATLNDRGVTDADYILFEINENGNYSYSRPSHTGGLLSTNVTSTLPASENDFLDNNEEDQEVRVVYRENRLNLTPESSDRFGWRSFAVENEDNDWQRGDAVLWQKFRATAKHANINRINLKIDNSELAGKYWFEAVIVPSGDDGLPWFGDDISKWDAAKGLIAVTRPDTADATWTNQEWSVWHSCTWRTGDNYPYCQPGVHYRWWETVTVQPGVCEISFAASGFYSDRAPSVSLMPGRDYYLGVAVRRIKPDCVPAAGLSSWSFSQLPPPLRWRKLPEPTSSLLPDSLVSVRARTSGVPISFLTEFRTSDGTSGPALYEMVSSGQIVDSTYPETITGQAEIIAEWKKTGSDEVIKLASLTDITPLRGRTRYASTGAWVSDSEEDLVIDYDRLSFGDGTTIARIDLSSGIGYMRTNYDSDSEQKYAIQQTTDWSNAFGSTWTKRYGKNRYGTRSTANTGDEDGGFDVQYGPWVAIEAGSVDFNGIYTYSGSWDRIIEVEEGLPPVPPQQVDFWTNEQGMILTTLWVEAIQNATWGFTDTEPWIDETRIFYYASSPQWSLWQTEWVTATLGTGAPPIVGGYAGDPDNGETTSSTEALIFADANDNGYLEFSMPIYKPDSITRTAEAHCGIPSGGPSVEISTTVELSTTSNDTEMYVAITSSRYEACVGDILRIPENGKPNALMIFGFRKNGDVHFYQGQSGGSITDETIYGSHKDQTYAWQAAPVKIKIINDGTPGVTRIGIWHGETLLFSDDHHQEFLPESENGLWVSLGFRHKLDLGGVMSADVGNITISKVSPVNYQLVPGEAPQLVESFEDVEDGWFSSEGMEKVNSKFNSSWFLAGITNSNSQNKYEIPHRIPAEDSIAATKVNAYWLPAAEKLAGSPYIQMTRSGESDPWRFRMNASAEDVFTTPSFSSQGVRWVGCHLVSASGVTLSNTSRAVRTDFNYEVRYPNLDYPSTLAESEFFVGVCNWVPTNTPGLSTGVTYSQGLATISFAETDFYENYRGTIVAEVNGVTKRIGIEPEQYLSDVTPTYAIFGFRSDGVATYTRGTLGKNGLEAAAPSTSSIGAALLPSHGNMSIVVKPITSSLSRCDLFIMVNGVKTAEVKNVTFDLTSSDGLHFFYGVRTKTPGTKYDLTKATVQSFSMSTINKRSFPDGVISDGLAVWEKTDGNVMSENIFYGRNVGANQQEGRSGNLLGTDRVLAQLFTPTTGYLQTASFRINSVTSGVAVAYLCFIDENGVPLIEPGVDGHVSPAHPAILATSWAKYLPGTDEVYFVFSPAIPLAPGVTYCLVVDRVPAIYGTADNPGTNF